MDLNETKKVMIFSCDNNCVHWQMYELELPKEIINAIAIDLAGIPSVESDGLDVIYYAMLQLVEGEDSIASGTYETNSDTEKAGVLRYGHLLETMGDWYCTSAVALNQLYQEHKFDFMYSFD